MGDGPRAADRRGRHAGGLGGARRRGRPGPHQQHQPDPARRFRRAIAGRGCRPRSLQRRDGVRAMTTTPTGLEQEAAPWSEEEFVAALRVQGERYHDQHPFHVRMNAGELSREELRRWVANRYYYQRSIPIKDAAILSNCPEVEIR